MTRFAEGASGRREAPCDGRGRGPLAERRFYSGGMLGGVDAKGRLALPASIRQVVETRSGQRTLFVRVHPTLPCLLAYDSDHVAKLSDGFERVEQRLLDEANGAEAGTSAARDVFGALEEVGFDSTGRFGLAPFLKARAGIGADVFYQGANTAFEIWSPDRALESGQLTGAAAERLRFDLEARA